MSFQGLYKFNYHTNKSTFLLRKESLIYVQNLSASLRIPLKKEMKTNFALANKRCHLFGGNDKQLRKLVKSEIGNESKLFDFYFEGMEFFRGCHVGILTLTLRCLPIFYQYFQGPRVGIRILFCRYFYRETCCEGMCSNQKSRILKKNLTTHSRKTNYRKSR